MKRKILLLLASFVLLGGAFLAYRAASQFGQLDLGDTVVAVDGDGDPQGSPGSLSGWKLNIKRSGPDGRLESIYRARRLLKQTDGSYKLVSPQFEIFLRNGQNLLIQADEGQVTGEEVTGGVEPHQGTLRGNVKIYIDRNPGPVPVEQRLEELIRIHLDDITFDNQFLTLRSHGDVVVYSREVDIYGREFFMSWNQQPRELRELRIEKGDSMHIKQMRRDVDMLFLPGGDTEQAHAGDEMAKTDPDDTAAQPDAEAEEPEDPFATRPARNVYVADLHDNVRVESTDQRFLRGAQRLTLVFEWTGKFEDPAARPDPMSDQTSDQPNGGTGNNAQAPAGSEKSTQADKPAEPFEIYWTGPLVITPQGRTENPSAKRYTVFAEGPSLHMADGQAEAWCQQFAFRNPERVGEMRSDDEPVRLQLEDGQVIRASLMQFDMRRRRAYFTGPGEMISPAGASRPLITRDPDLQAAGQDQPPLPQIGQGGDRITWTDKVTAKFSEHTFADQTGRTQSREFIDEVIFTGDVELLSAAGDYVLCDRQLEVYMAVGDNGRSYPSKVMAAGNVAANWEESAIEAASIILDFREMPVTDETGAKSLAIRATNLQADQNVWAASVSNGQLLEVTCDRLASDLLSRTAQLTGDPATVRSGENALSGRQIDLTRLPGEADRQPAHILDVNGAGRLRFLTDRDLDGGQLSRPRPITIDWSEHMSFHGRRKTAAFVGNVVLDSTITKQTPDDPNTVESEIIQCSRMEVEFLDKPDTQARPDAAEKTENQEDSARANPLAIRLDSYSDLSFSTITADGGVTFISRQLDSKNQKLLRLFLQGPRMVYDAREQAKEIKVVGTGSLLIEDYRPSRLPGNVKSGRDDAGRSGLRGDLTSPSQTSFAWTKALTFKQLDREVMAEGDVRMARVSGNRVVFADRLNAPAWPEQSSGDRWDLRHADVAIATFGESEQDEQTEKNTNPQIGVLQTLSATGSVLFEVPDISITAQSIRYSRQLEMFTVLGSLPGQAPSRALLTRRDPKTNRTTAFRGREILWFLKNNHVQARDVAAGGAR